jgi:hypothetical protein
MRPIASTVTVPAIDRKLVSLDDLREQLRVKPNDTANDSWLSKVINRTSRQAERYCNRIFVPQGYAETFVGTSTNASEPLILSQAPIDPTSLVVTLDGTVLDARAYTLDEFAGLLYRFTAGWSISTSLVVAYTAGFDPIPPDVEQAVLDLCVMENSGRGRDPMLRASESPGLGRQEFWVGGLPGSPAIPQEIAASLDTYHRGLIG